MFFGAATVKLDAILQVEEVGDTNGYNSSGYDVYEDTIEWIDTFGYKANLTFVAGPIQAYLQGAYMGWWLMVAAPRQFASGREWLAA